MDHPVRFGALYHQCNTLSTPFCEASTWYAATEEGTHSAQVARRIERPTDKWFHDVRNEPGAHAWMIHEAGSPVAFIQLDGSSDRAGSFSIVIKPEMRHRGLCKRLLPIFLARPEVLSLHRLEAGVEQDNHAALRCLRSTGFRQEGKGADSEGFVQLLYEPQSIESR